MGPFLRLSLTHDRGGSKVVESRKRVKEGTGWHAANSGSSLALRTVEQVQDKG